MAVMRYYNLAGLNIVYIGGWRDDLRFKGPRFKSQHPHASSRGSDNLKQIYMEAEHELNKIFKILNILYN